MYLCKSRIVSSAKQVISCIEQFFISNAIVQAVAHTTFDVLQFMGLLLRR